jgi:peroxiredoxin
MGTLLMTSTVRYYKPLDHGDPAPSFSLPAFPGGTAALNDYLGNP